jgi:hypothetical protein
MARAPVVARSDRDARLAALEQRVAVLEARADGHNVHGVIDDRAAACLSAIASATRGAAFSARELLAHAAVDAALARVLPSTTKQIGQQLRRLRDQPCAGLVLRRLDPRDEHGCIWQVQLHPDAGRRPAAGR